MAVNKIINVLYVDDEENNLISFNATFRRHFTVFTALSAKEAKIILVENEIHVLITDQRMPDTLGTELLAEAVKKNSDQIRILLTAYMDIEAVMDAINRGQVFKCLKKPWNDNELYEAIIEGYDIYALKQKEKKLVEELRKSFEELAASLKQ